MIIKKQCDEHLPWADVGYKMQRYDEDLCKPEECIADHEFMWLDFAATQKCPVLAVNTAYYKSKLSVYPYGIYSGTTKKANWYIWDESVARKGPNEVCSVLEQDFSS